MRFSEPPCVRRGICPGRAPACSARSRSCHRPPPSIVDLGITYLRAGELDKALGQFEAGLNVSTPSRARAGLGRRHCRPSDAGADRRRRTSRGGTQHPRPLLGRNGARSRDVAAEFRDAIRLRPDFAEAHNHLGLVLIQAGEDEAGIASLREAVRISPDYAEARANLGAALTPTDAEAAIRELEKAVALAPASVKAQFNLAVAYGASADAGTREGDRAAAQGHRARADVRTGPPGARQGAPSGRQGARRGCGPPGSLAARAEERRSPLSARPGARAGGAPGRGHG